MAFFTSSHSEMSEKGLMRTNDVLKPHLRGRMSSTAFGYQQSREEDLYLDTAERERGATLVPRIFGFREC